MTGASISDITRSVSYEADPSSIVNVSKTGHVTPLSDGSVKVIAKTSEGLSTSIELTVEQFGTPQPITFRMEIVPLFTKHGCNGGGCHGKSEGQNGFKLSLLGFEPTEDFEYLVKEVEVGGYFLLRLNTVFYYEKDQATCRMEEVLDLTMIHGIIRP